MGYSRDVQFIHKDVTHAVSVNFFPLLMKFYFLAATTMKIAVFWHVTPCSLVEMYRHFGKRGLVCINNYLHL
jgi:hypothetical protein